MIQHNCSTCRYHNADACAVNPTYWDMTRAVARLNIDSANQICQFLQPCPDWEHSEPKTIALTLSENEWREIEYRWRDSAHLATQSFLEQVKAAIGYQAPKPDSDIDPLPF